jgi:hypothetical protein
MNARELIRRYNNGERNFCEANLRGADLSGAYLYEACLGGAYLYEANLGGAYLSRANLNRANISGANLYEACLGGANLSGANLGRADLRGANLNRANLRGANLSGACLGGANLSGANLGRADLSGTCLDQTNKPNMIGKFEEFESGWLIGYRTKNSPHGFDTGPYKVGQERWAHQFSTDDTECHPGLFICPTIDEAKDWGNTIVSVIFRPWELHKAGNKHRVRWFIVWEDINQL